MRILLSLFILSSAVIAYQLALMQLLSIVQWYHFAFMIISVALLGFGASGTFLSIFRTHCTRYKWLPSLSMITAGMAMAWCPTLIQSDLIRFDSYQLFADYSQVSKLVITYLIFFVPFFLAGLAIGIIFFQHARRIGKLYFSNLIGSAVGGVLALLAMQWFMPQQLPEVISFLPVSAGVLLIPVRRVLSISVIALVSLGVVTYRIVTPSTWHMSQYKDLSKVLLLPDAKIIAHGFGVHGLVEAVQTPALRYAPGLSLVAQSAANVKAALFVNGNWFGAVADDSQENFVLDYTSKALPYAIGLQKDVLVLEAGTGLDVLHALSHRSRVTATEENMTILSMLKNELDSIHHVYEGKTSVHNLAARSFLMIDSGHYDLIILPMIGSFGGTAGLFALQEQYLMTKESFTNMWDRLTDSGSIAITSWMDYPVRNPLKVLATLTALASEKNLNPTRHIAAVRSWATITFVITKRAITQEQVSNILTFCDQMLFDPVLLPTDNFQRSQYNQLQDTQVFSYFDQLMTSRRKELYKKYSFNIEPATDERPYFSQFIKMSRLDDLAEFFNNRTLPFFEVGYLLVVLTLGQITILSIILIILPLLVRKWRGGSKLPVFLYFGGIGLGYMFVEITLIQRFNLYLGNPVYSIAAVITSLLLFSGLGSFFSETITKKIPQHHVLGLIFGLLMTYAFVLTPMLQSTIYFPTAAKWVMTALLIGLPGFLMGIPFPAGLTHLNSRQTEAIPWAWGLNGCLSVVSTALATVIAVEAGFGSVMVIAALAYALAAVVGIFWK